MNLVDVVALARGLNSLTDSRPDYLKGLAIGVNPGARYYRFLYELVDRIAPVQVLEIGTDRAVGTMHLAGPNRGGTVVTVDVNHASSEAAHRVIRSSAWTPAGTIEPLTTSSGCYINSILSRNPRRFDLVFVDGAHTFNDAYSEYVGLRPYIADGGIMLFDDIHLDVDGMEMDVFWDFVIDDKAELSELHETGFGAVAIQHKISPPPWHLVIADATARMNANDVLRRRRD